jgi:hypothetical protein
MKARTELVPGLGIRVLAAETQDAGWIVSAVFPETTQQAENVDMLKASLAEFATIRNARSLVCDGFSELGDR